MTPTMYSISIPVLTKMLGSLSRILDQASNHIASHHWEEANVLQTRLFPDMFPLIKQVQLATDFGKGAAARLAGIEVPKFEDNETSIAQLQNRITQIIAFIESVDVAAINSSAEREISIPMRQETLVLPGLDYLTLYALPNFYFHATTAYGILRHIGVPIGKRDFLGRQ